MVRKKTFYVLGRVEGSASFCCCLPSCSALCLRKYQTGMPSFGVLASLQMLLHRLIVRAGRGCRMFWWSVAWGLVGGCCRPGIILHWVHNFIRAWLLLWVVCRPGLLMCALDWWVQQRALGWLQHSGLTRWWRWGVRDCLLHYTSVPMLHWHWGVFGWIEWSFSFIRHGKVRLLGVRSR
jgi:hypothetical protein